MQAKWTRRESKKVRDLLKNWKKETEIYLYYVIYFSYAIKGGFI